MAKPSAKRSGILSETKTITQIDVADWLRGAGAPEPWDADLIDDAARNLEELRLQLPWHVARAKPRPAAHKAQKAINELRNALPGLIQVAELELPDRANHDRAGRVIVACQKQIDQLRRMHMALIDVVEKSNYSYKNFYAASVFQIVQLLCPRVAVDHGGDSISLMFVAAALGEMASETSPQLKHSKSG